MFYEFNTRKSHLFESMMKGNWYRMTQIEAELQSVVSRNLLKL